jgi:hypothetical protein
MQYLVGLLTILAVACGPSSKEVATAKTAHYQGDKLMLFATVKAEVESKYKISTSDETTLGMQTQARWFSPEGLTTSATAEDERDLPDKSIYFAVVVTLLPDGSSWVVRVKPLLKRKNKGMPKPDDIKEGDASLPGWVESRTDQLALDIHKALAKYEVKQPGGLAPSPAPGPSPDEPSTAPGATPTSAQGSGTQGSAATP